MILDLIYISIGAIIGACLRYILTKYLPFTIYNLVIINIIACILLVFFSNKLSHFNKLSHTQKLLLITGLCGSLSSFSTYILDLYTLWKNKQWFSLFSYFSLSNILSFIIIYILKI